MSGPLASRSDRLKLNHGTVLKLNLSLRQDQVSACITHSTFFREKREEFYNVQPKAARNTTTYFSRIMDLHGQAEFLDDTNFLIVDTLTHRCTNKQCRRKLIAKGKDVFVK